MSEPILLKDCTIAIDAFASSEHADILIEEGRISKVGRGMSTNGIKIDCSSCVVIPGFMNGHTHSPMTLLRGVAEDMSLHDWLSKKVWPIENKLKDRHFYIGAKIAVLEMLRSGFTAAADMYFNMMQVAKAYEELSFRGILCEGVVDNFNEDETEAKLRKQKEMYRRLASLKSGIIKASLGPHATYTCSENLLRGIADFSKEEKALVHIHVAEAQEDQRMCLRRHKAREVEFLRRIGMCNSRSVYAHGVWLSDKEMKIAGEAHASVVQNAISNLKVVNGGVADITALQKKKVKVCLGTDGPASNNSLDALEMMKFAALLQKHIRKDATAITAKEIFRCATFEGYRIFLPELRGGRIAEGAVADLAVFEVDKIRHSPLLKPLGSHMVSHLVYSSSGLRARDVIVNGKLSLQDYRLPDVGEESIYEEFGRAAAELYGTG